MGEQYRRSLEEKIKELGAGKLSVFINSDGVDPHYQRHLEDTFRDAGVRFVLKREEANFIFEGSCSPSFHAGKVIAYFQGGQLSFMGRL